MLPLAGKHRLRLVPVNRRGYASSSPLTDEDLANLTSPDDDTRARYCQTCALEFGEFMAWFVQKEKIPKFTVAEDGKPRGGIVLLGWSLAPAWLLGLLAYPDLVPSHTREVLEPYFRAFCIYG